jgi:hypothetical protein
LQVINKFNILKDYRIDWRAMMIMDVNKKSKPRLTKLALASLGCLFLLGGGAINVYAQQGGMYGPSTKQLLTSINLNLVGVNRSVNSSVGQVNGSLGLVNKNLNNILSGIASIDNNVIAGNKINFAATNIDDASGLFSNTVNFVFDSSINTFAANKPANVHSSDISKAYTAFDGEIAAVSCYNGAMLAPGSADAGVNLTITADSIKSKLGTGQNGSTCSNEYAALVAQTNTYITASQAAYLKQLAAAVPSYSKDEIITKNTQYKNSAFMAAQSSLISQAMSKSYTYPTSGDAGDSTTKMLKSYHLLDLDDAPGASGSNLENFSKLWLGTITNSLTMGGLDPISAANLNVINNAVATVAKVKSSNRNNDDQQASIQALLSQQLSQGYLQKLGKANTVQLTRIMVINGIVNNYLQNQKLQALHNIEKQNNASLLVQSAALTGKLVNNNNNNNSTGS